MADYPGAVPTFPTIDAGAGDLLDTTGKEHDFMHNRASEEIIALATALGINPTTIVDTGTPTESSAPTTVAAVLDLVAALLHRILETYWLSEPLYSLMDVAAMLNPALNDVQRIQVPASVTGGTLTVTIQGVTSAPIAWDADTATWDAALEAMSNIGSGNVAGTVLSGGSGTPSHFQIHFNGSGWTGKPLPTVLVDPSGLTGPDSPYAITVNHITHGGVGHNHDGNNNGTGGPLHADYAKLTSTQTWTATQNFRDISIAANRRIDIVEATSDFGNPSANTARLYALDNGAGKTQLKVIFPSGAAIVLATEP